MRRENARSASGVLTACLLTILLAGLMAGAFFLSLPVQAASPRQGTGPGGAFVTEDRPVPPKPHRPAWLEGLPPWAVDLATGLSAGQSAGEATTEATAGVSLVKAVSTSGSSGTAINGEYVTYTISVVNAESSGVPVSVVLDVLPEDTFENVTCSSPCSLKTDEVNVPDPLGGTIAVTVTRWISWSVGTVAANSTQTMWFKGRVIGQAEGSSITNRAFMLYKVGSANRTGTSNQTSTTVRARIEAGSIAQFSAAATWLSQDRGGTLSMDWGDFDGDGYPDLALGSTISTTIYHNDTGQLSEFGYADQKALGVRWADIDGDGKLELIAVGDSTNGVQGGVNYIYHLNAAGTAFTSTTFNTDWQLLRVSPGHYAGGSRYDLLASTNAIQPPCPVTLFLGQNNKLTYTQAVTQCVSTRATANLAGGDSKNRGLLDLALGLFPNETAVIPNAYTSGVTNTTYLTTTHKSSVDTSTGFLAYDYAWGDFDKDGNLDLAAAYPLEKRARVYRNEGNGVFKLVATISTTAFRSPLSVVWGDFNGDGLLDLAVADSPPKIYLNTGSATTPFNSNDIMTLPAVRGQIWSMAAADADNDGDLDLAVSNRDGSSVLFTNFASMLSRDLTTVAGHASSVAWGDADGSGWMSLLYGAGNGELFAYKVANSSGTFGATSQYMVSGFGPQAVAYGDINGDGKLEVAIGSNGGVQIYESGNYLNPIWTIDTPANALAFGDANSDGWLDLLVGGETHSYIYLNDKGTMATSPSWTSEETGNATSVAWGDFDGDHWPDFAVANSASSVRVYHNNWDGSFTPVWTSRTFENATSLAWADVDGDGDLDLAIGVNGGTSEIVENADGAFTTVREWPLDSTYQSATSVAWGDWNNDGHPDLAVGNWNGPVQVYINRNSQPNSLQMQWLWQSNASYATSGVAWGDYDRDGDLDLAISREDGPSGVFVNNYVQQTNVGTAFTKAMPLPHSASYVFVARPGSAGDAYLYSSSDLLAGPDTDGTVTIKYKVYSPEGTNRQSGRDSTTFNGIISSAFQYSLDGGGSWHTATPASTSGTPSTLASRLGVDGTFIWNARTDEAISDDARFRISVVNTNTIGAVQRTMTSAISPPFRVRATTCTWPVGPSLIGHPYKADGITVDTGSTNLQPNKKLNFAGDIEDGDGQMVYRWDFGDGTSKQVGQVVTHKYVLGGTYSVRMGVTSEACPESRTITKTVSLVIGLPNNIFLPKAAK